MALPRALLIMVSSLIQIEIGLLLSWNALRGPLISSWVVRWNERNGQKGKGVAGHKFYHVRRSRGDPATKLLDSIIRLFNFLASNFIVDTIFFLLFLFFEILVKYIVPIILHFYYSLKKELKEKMELREILYINGIIVY